MKADISTLHKPDILILRRHTPIRKLFPSSSNARLRQSMARGSSTKSLPIGTPVVALTQGQGPKDDEVCPQGSLGVVVGRAKSTSDSYQIRLTDGSIVTFSRACLAIRK